MKGYDTLNEIDLDNMVCFLDNNFTKFSRFIIVKISKPFILD